MYRKVNGMVQTPSGKNEKVDNFFPGSQKAISVTFGGRRRCRGFRL